MELGLRQRRSESYPVFSRSDGLASFLCVMGRDINSQIDLSEITSQKKGSPIRVPRIRWVKHCHDLASCFWEGHIASKLSLRIVAPH